MNSKQIELTPYNSQWPEIYEHESLQISSVLECSLLNIYHVGSTSIPGLSAKPKIDIIAEVKSLEFDDKDLVSLGYSYRGGFNLPFRKSYTKRTPALSVNLHIFEENDPEIELNLKFRDYIRLHDKSKQEYQNLKYNLIEDEASHQKRGALFTGYTLGKHDFIQKILQETGYNRFRMVICTHYREWEAAKYFRQHYFFDKVNIQDPYTWTFNHDQHIHLVLYLATEIIGYAHIQLWPENRAALRIIVVNEDKRNRNYGGQFLAMCEKLLKMRGVKSIHIESSPEAINFYRNNGYTDMPFNDPDGYESFPQDIPVGKML